MGPCSRCGAGTPPRRVHRWCAHCLWEYKQSRASSHEGNAPRAHHLYVFENVRLPGEYKIGRTADVEVRAQALQQSQSIYVRNVASFDGKGHLEGKVRKMLAYCLLPREVAPGREWHACPLQTALGAIGPAVDDEKAQQ